MSELATQINALIAKHGCHMQQTPELIDHIVEHADEIRRAEVEEKTKSADVDNEENSSIDEKAVDDSAETVKLMKPKSKPAKSKR